MRHYRRPPGRAFGWLHPPAVARLRLVQSLLAVPLWLSPPAAATPPPPPPHLRCPRCGQFTLAVMGYVQMPSALVNPPRSYPG